MQKGEMPVNRSENSKRKLEELNLLDDFLFEKGYRDYDY